MPILSFSVKKAELLNHVKTDTTRVFTAHRWKELVQAVEEGRTLYIWWKSRTKQREHLFDSRVFDLSLICFKETPSGVWPWHGVIFEVRDDTPIFDWLRPYTPEEVDDYVRREGFETLTEFVNVLHGKDGAIEGWPMIRIRFWGASS